MSKRVIGCDPSLTGTALAVGIPGLAVATHEYSSKDKGNRVEQRNARYAEILAPCIELTREVRPDIMVIEGHPLGAVMGKVFDRTELRGQLMLELSPFVGEWLEIDVWQLKHFAGWKSGESDLIPAVQRKWGRLFKSHNQADAYALMMIGNYLGGIVSPHRCLQDLVPQLVAEERPPKPESKRARSKKAQLGLLGGA